MSLFVSLWVWAIFRFFDWKVRALSIWPLRGAFVEKFPKTETKVIYSLFAQTKGSSPSVSGLHKYQLSLWFFGQFFLSFFLVLIQMISSNPNPSLFIRSESGVGPGSGRRQLVASRDLSPPRDAATMCVGGLNFHTYQRLPDFETVCNLAVVW